MAASKALKPKDPSSRAATRPLRSMVNSYGSVRRPNCRSGFRMPCLTSLST